MSVNPSIDISRDERGYYVLKINGKFEGNYDTAHEAALEAEDYLKGCGGGAV